MDNKGKQLYMANRQEWRAWLGENHDKEKEVWLVYFKKHTGKPSIPYDDAVEEALCFGWIDSLVHTIDDERYTQKYTPRKAKSIWSELNKTRVQKMIEQGKMTPAGLKLIEEAKANGQWHKATPSRNSPIEIPSDVEQALLANEHAWKNFMGMTASQRSQYIYWILDAKREETRQKRINDTVRRAEQNMKPGIV